MVEKIRIKLKDLSLMGVKSSKEAFVASKITKMWQNSDEIFQTVKTVVNRDDFHSIINSFYERGAIEKETEKKAQNGDPSFSLSGHEDIRDYGRLVFNERELNDIPELPLNLKKEMLFLFYYGRGLDMYKVLNVPDGHKSSQDDVIYACSKYRKIFALRNFEGIDIGAYAKKLDKVREILRKAFKLEEPAIRNDYNTYLKSLEERGPKEKRSERDIKESTEDAAFKHFLSAMKHLAEKNIEKAYRDIQVALHIDPANPEFNELKKEIGEAVKAEKVNVLLYAIENDDSLMMNEKKLEKAINMVLELTDESPLMMIKIAESALEKEMPQMVIEFASKAASIDGDLQDKATELIVKAERLKKAFHVDNYKDSVFHID